MTTTALHGIPKIPHVLEHGAVTPTALGNIYSPQAEADDTRRTLIKGRYTALTGETLSKWEGRLAIPDAAIPDIAERVMDTFDEAVWRLYSEPGLRSTDLATNNTLAPKLNEAFMAAHKEREAWPAPGETDSPSVSQSRQAVFTDVLKALQPKVVETMVDFERIAQLAAQGNVSTEDKRKLGKMLSFFADLHEIPKEEMPTVQDITRQMAERGKVPNRSAAVQTPASPTEFLTRTKAVAAAVTVAVAIGTAGTAAAAERPSGAGPSTVATVGQGMAETGGTVASQPETASTGTAPTDQPAFLPPQTRKDNKAGFEEAVGSLSPDAQTFIEALQEAARTDDPTAVLPDAHPESQSNQELQEAMDVASDVVRGLVAGDPDYKELIGLTGPDTQALATQGTDAGLSPEARAGFAWALTTLASEVETAQVAPEQSPVAVDPPAQATAEAPQEIAPETSQPQRTPEGYAILTTNDLMPEWRYMVVDAIDTAISNNNLLDIGLLTSEEAKMSKVEITPAIAAKLESYKELFVQVLAGDAETIALFDEERIKSYKAILEDALSSTENPLHIVKGGDGHIQLSAEQTKAFFATYLEFVAYVNSEMPYPDSETTGDATQDESLTEVEAVYNILADMGEYTYSDDEGSRKADWKNIAYIWKRFVKAGYSPEVAIGFVANCIAESGCNPDRNQANGPAYGIFQWEGGRKDKLLTWKHYDTLKTQVDYTLYELNGSEKLAKRAIKRAQNAVEAARLVCNKFERPGVPYMGIRVGIAGQIAQVYKDVLKELAARNTDSTDESRGKDRKEVHVTDTGVVIPEELASYGYHIRYYSQWDARWAAEQYSSVGDEAQTMASSGCGPTSLAMVMSSLTNKDILPTDIAKFNINHGYRTPADGTAFAAFPAFAEKYGVTVKDVTKSKEAIKEFFAKHGKDGKQGYIIVSGKDDDPATPATSSGHFYVIYGITDGGDLLVADSNSEEKSTENGDSGWNAETILSSTGSFMRGFYI